MKDGYDSFEDLWIWSEAMEICHEVYLCMKDSRNFKLKDQMFDSSVSMPSNIAEGFELHTDRLFIRHLYISKGSAGELRTQMYLAIRQQHVPEDIGKNLINRIKRLAAGIQNFIAEREKKSRRKSTQKI